MTRGNEPCLGGVDKNVLNGAEPGLGVSETFEMVKRLLVDDSLDAELISGICRTMQRVDRQRLDAEILPEIYKRISEDEVGMTKGLLTTVMYLACLPGELKIRDDAGIYLFPKNNSMLVNFGDGGENARMFQRMVRRSTDLLHILINRDENRPLSPELILKLLTERQNGGFTLMMCLQYLKSDVNWSMRYFNQGRSMPPTEMLIESAVIDGLLLEHQNTCHFLTDGWWGGVFCMDMNLDLKVVNGGTSENEVRECVERMNRDSEVFRWIREIGQK